MSFLTLGIFWVGRVHHAADGVLLYWMNILAFGALLLASWRYAKHAGLVEADVSAMIDLSVQRRIYVAYALGAALGVGNTYWSIGFIILVQLNYVVGPRIGVLARICGLMSSKAEHAERTSR